MSVLIIGPKCMLAASHAAPWWVMVSMLTGQRDKRTNKWMPDHYVMFLYYGHSQRDNLAYNAHDKKILNRK